MHRRCVGGGELVGDVAEIEVPEDAVELRHVDVGDAGIATNQQHVLVVLQERVGGEIRRPEHTSGSSDSGIDQ